MLKKLYQKFRGKSSVGADSLPSATILEPWSELFKNYDLLWHTAVDSQHTNVVVECCKYHISRGFSLNWMGPFDELPSALLNSTEFKHTGYAIKGLNLLPDLVNYSLTVKDFSLLKSYLGLSFYFFKKCDGSSLAEAIEAWQVVDSVSILVWERCIRRWALLDMQVFEEILEALIEEDSFNREHWSKLLVRFTASQLVSLFNTVSPSYVAKPLPLEGVESRSLQPELRVFRVVDIESSASVVYELETLFSCLLVVQSFLIKETGLKAWPGLFLVPEQFGSAQTAIANKLLTLSRGSDTTLVYHTPFNSKGFLDNNVLLGHPGTILTFLSAWQRSTGVHHIDDVEKLRAVLHSKRSKVDSSTFAVVKREENSWKVAYVANIDKTDA